MKRLFNNLEGYYIASLVLFNSYLAHSKDCLSIFIIGSLLISFEYYLLVWLPGKDVIIGKLIKHIDSTYKR